MWPAFFQLYMEGLAATGGDRDNAWIGEVVERLGDILGAGYPQMMISACMIHLHLREPSTVPPGLSQDEILAHLTDPNKKPTLSVKMRQQWAQQMLRASEEQVAQLEEACYTILKRGQSFLQRLDTSLRVRGIPESFRRGMLVKYITLRDVLDCLHSEVLLIPRWGQELTPQLKQLASRLEAIFQEYDQALTRMVGDDLELSDCNQVEAEMGRVYWLLFRGKPVIHDHIWEIALRCPLNWLARICADDEEILGLLEEGLED